jgi:hypothetical protein
MLLAINQEYMIEKQQGWIKVNGAKWAFHMKTDEGEDLLVRHCRKIGTLAREKGFYVPGALVKLPILFEVKMKEDCYTHYIYRPSEKHCLVKSGGDVFISLAAMEVFTDTEHIAKPKG